MNTLPSAVAALGLASLCACGGSGGAPAALPVHATAPASMQAGYVAYTYPSSLPAVSVIANANGAVASIAFNGKPSALGGFDAGGNATTVDGGFDKVLAVAGSAALQLCRATADGTGGFKSVYSMAQASAEPASPAELRGKKFKVYQDCVYSHDASINADGSLTTDARTETPAAVSAAFGAAGYTFTELGVTANIKAVAYRLTANGATRYIIADRGNVVPYLGTVAYSALWVSVP